MTFTSGKLLNLDLRKSTGNALPPLRGYTEWFTLNSLAMRKATKIGQEKFAQYRKHKLCSEKKEAQDRQNYIHENKWRRSRAQQSEENHQGTHTCWSHRRGPSRKTPKHMAHVRASRAMCLCSALKNRAHTSTRTSHNLALIIVGNSVRRLRDIAVDIVATCILAYFYIALQRSAPILQERWWWH